MPEISSSTDSNSVEQFQNTPKLTSINALSLANDALLLVMKSSNVQINIFLATLTPFELLITPVVAHALRYEVQSRINSNLNQMTVDGNAISMAHKIQQEIVANIDDISANVEGSIVPKFAGTDYYRVINNFDMHLAQARLAMPKILQDIMQSAGFSIMLVNQVSLALQNEQKILNNLNTLMLQETQDDRLFNTSAAITQPAQVTDMPPVDMQHRLSAYLPLPPLMIGLPIASITLLCAYTLLKHRLHSFSNMRNFFSDAFKSGITFMSFRAPSYQAVEQENADDHDLQQKIGNVL